MMYERYVDDSNQVAVVPPPGAKYDPLTKKVIIDENLLDLAENEEERTARILTDVANSILPGITMEFDIPGRNPDNKMPILDMKVRMDEHTGDIIFEHYEKPTASHNILHAASAQSVSCRNSVHTQEILRRLLNSSPLLDWKADVAPVLSIYMARMMYSGYPERYRVDTLTRALRIYDKMVEEDDNGQRPLYTSPDCLPCEGGRGEGGNCRGCGVNYILECKMCPATERCVYIGESSRNLYTRSKEHLSNYRNGSPSSFMSKHQTSAHPGEEPSFRASVTASTRDCLTRQVKEAVLIRRSQVPVLNGKTEWHQPALFRIQSEIERG